MKKTKKILKNELKKASHWGLIMVLFLLLIHVSSTNATSKAEYNSGSIRNIQLHKQESSISGTVYNENGEVMPFVNVYFANNNQGVITNNDGHYYLKYNPTKDVVLLASFIGYKKQYVKLSGQKTVDFKMVKSVTNVDEVVVTGYQTLSKERASGAFGTMDKEVLKLKPVKSVKSLLEGQIAGVNGTDIRGISSFHSTTPLIVVDGFPIQGGLESINPNNIESVTVLKDASAASIWGARSANGVIVVTTKRAAEGQKDNMTVSLSSFVRIGDKVDLDYANPIPNSTDQLKLEKYFTEEYYKANPKSIQTPDVLTWENSFAMMKTEGSYLEGMRSIGYLDDNVVDKRIDELKKISYKDDVNEYLLRHPVYQQNNISIRGNSGKHNYNFNLLYDNNTASYVGSKSNTLKVDFRDYFKFNKHLTFLASVYTSISKDNNNGASLSEIKNLAPYDRLISPDGTWANNSANMNYGVRSYLNQFDFPYSWNYNLLQEVINRDLTSENIENRLQFGVNLKINKALSFNSKIQYERWKMTSRNFYNDNTYYVRSKINAANRFEKGVVSDRYYPEGGIIESNKFNNKEAYDFRNQMNFDKVFAKKHHVNAIVGMELIQNKNDGTSLPPVFGVSNNRTGVSALPDMNTHLDYGVIDNQSNVGDRRIPRYSYGKVRYFSAYSNVSYTYDKRYTFTGSVRTDASNIVSDRPKYRYTPLWSTGVNWNLKNETFMKDVDVIDRLNIRASYGINANAATLSSNVTTVAYNAGRRENNYKVSSVFNTGNPDLRWETTRTLNLGADFALLNNKLYGSLDIYNRKGEDLYYNRTYPSTIGISSLQVNYASITNKGVEISLGTKLSITKDLSINSKVNYSYDNNKITKLETVKNTISDQRGSSTYVKGASVRDLWAFKYNGYDTKGVPNVIGSDGTLHAMNTPVPSMTNKSLPLLYNQGHTIAPHLLGWTNTVNLYDFSLTTIITGKFGSCFKNSAIPFGGSTVMGQYNYNKDLSKYIKNPQASDFPGQIDAKNMSFLRQQRLYVDYLSSYVDNASFIRFNDIIINYNLNRHLKKLKFIANANVYCNISNVGLIWTANKWHMDPEYPMGTTKPQRMYTVGLKIDLK